MITRAVELEATLARIRKFQEQVALIRAQESDPASYRSSVGGYLAELDRMTLEVREFLWSHPDDEPTRARSAS